MPANPALVAALTRLAGRKIVYTNGSVRARREPARASRHRATASTDIFDIVASDFAPKPAIAPFREFVGRYGVEPRTALMVEDMAKTWRPPPQLGMTTAWVRTDVDWAAIASEADYIHHVVDDLAGFLGAAVELEKARRDERRRYDPRKLTGRFVPTRLEIIDDSHRHAGHAGARPGGETHFTVTIVSDAFTGLSRVARQRLVYETLAEELAARSTPSR